MFLKRNNILNDDSLPKNFHLTSEAGIFDTFKIQCTPQQTFEGLMIRRHIERFLTSLPFLKFPAEKIPSPIEIKNNLQTLLQNCTVQHPDETSFTVRLIATKDFEILYQAIPFTPRFTNPNAVTILCVTGERVFPTIKHSLVELSLNGQKDAVTKGADEALFISPDGYIRECSWSNFFWANAKGEIFTSGKNILPGITRSFILECAQKSNLTIRIEETTVADLLTHAKSAFITSSLQGISQVRKIILMDGSEITLSETTSLELLRRNYRVLTSTLY